MTITNHQCFSVSRDDATGRRPGRAASGARTRAKNAKTRKPPPDPLPYGIGVYPKRDKPTARRIRPKNQQNHAGLVW